MERIGTLRRHAQFVGCTREKLVEGANSTSIFPQEIIFRWYTAMPSRHATPWRYVRLEAIQLVLSVASG